jgi:Mycobacterium membrane protein
MVERGVRDIAGTESAVADTGPVDIGQESGRRRSFLRRAGRAPTAPPPLSESREIRRNRGFSIFKVLGRLWVPLVILAVVVAGGFAVSRLHGIFGSEKQHSYSDTRVDDAKPFNPKHLRYEVFGAPGTAAEISYFDVNGEPQHLKGVGLPWSLEFAIGSATAVGNVVAQGDTDRIGCRILVDNVVKAEKISHETSAFAFCMLKAA